MSQITISILSDSDLQAIHHTSLRVLRDVGVMVNHTHVLDCLQSAGASVDRPRRIARFDENMVIDAISRAGKQFIVHGRDSQRVARFGYGEPNLISSPGQYAWFDYRTNARRDTVLADARDAIKVGDALENISIVGAMTAPVDIPTPVRDVVLTAELVKGTIKPTRCWPVSRASSRFVLEIYKVLAGGEAALRQRPMVDFFLEPISPLQFPETGIDAMIEFLALGQPVSIGPMAMVSGTGPATIAGTLAQENAEILAGIVTVQAIAPGTPIMYGGIPHIMDQRTSICSFGSPEQGLMAVAMAQIAKHYGFPVYINVNLTDSKVLDVQAGFEKMGSLVTGILAGADLIGHAGIVGTDHGGSLPWLVVDNEAVSYANRVRRGFDIDAESLAASVIAEVGPTGHYLMHEHTLRHFRNELWFPNDLWTRDTFTKWDMSGPKSMGDRARERVFEILENHQVPPLDSHLEREINLIVDAAYRELVG